MCACGQFAGLTHMCAGTPVYFDSTPTPATERAIVLRERAAAARARCSAEWGHARRNYHCAWIVNAPCAECRAWAAKNVPLPQRQTVRYEPDPQHPNWIRWCCLDGVEMCVQQHLHDGVWIESSSNRVPTFARIDLWNKLRARPFTLVDDDGGTTP